MNLTEQDLKDLNTYLMEQPAKFSLPIVNFLNEIKTREDENITNQEENG